MNTHMGGSNWATAGEKWTVTGGHPREWIELGEKIWLPDPNKILVITVIYKTVREAQF